MHSVATSIGPVQSLACALALLWQVRKADVIVSNWAGHGLLGGGMLRALARARCEDLCTLLISVNPLCTRVGPADPRSSTHRLALAPAPECVLLLVAGLTGFSLAALVWQAQLCDPFTVPI